MFKKSDKVSYPRHGAGIINKIFSLKLAGTKELYYKILFPHDAVSVSVPAKNSKLLGLRSLTPSKELKKKLEELKKPIKISKKILTTLDATSHEKLSSGSIDDAIYLVRLLKSLARKKEEENRNFSYSYSDHLEIAQDFIKSEIAMTIGDKYCKNYPELFKR